MVAARDWFDRALERTSFDKERGCWLYQGEIVHNGYGRIWHAGRNVRLHRLSFQRFVGPIPTGLLICHKCDVRHCWNPMHLFAGTTAENSYDAAKKGRILSTTLTAENVREIRELIGTQDLSDRQIGLRFGVGPTAVRKIRQNINWVWLV